MLAHASLQGDDGAAAIADGLVENTRLLTVNLSGNSIKCHGMELLAAVLKASCHYFSRYPLADRVGHHVSMCYPAHIYV